MQTKLADYTEDEIRRIYRNQEDRTQGVAIIKQLTGWSTQKICDILITGGYVDVKTPPEKGTSLCGYKFETVFDIYTQGY